MSLKTVRYPGTDIDIEYDSAAPCIVCGLPVVEASMGGTRLCPWCDCGRYRDGCEFAWRWDSKAQKLNPVFPHPEHAAVTA